jgi:hypothetical protein
MASPKPMPPVERAEPKAIGPRCCVCTEAHQESRCPRLVVPEAMKSRGPSGSCKWCGQKLPEGVRFFHEECSHAAEGRL